MTGTLLHLPTPKSVPLIAAAVPFGDVKRYASPLGLTVAEMAARVPSDVLPPYFWQGAGQIRIIWSDDHGAVIDQAIVPQHLWHCTRPKWAPGKNPQVVFGVNLQGGGGAGGHKNALQIVALVAVIAISFAVSGGALGGAALLGPGFAAGTFGAQAGGAAISIAGTMAIAALSKPPVLPNLSAPSAGKPPNTASVQVNTLQAGASLPCVVGTKRIYPPALCEPLTEFIGDDVYVETVLGLAGPHKITGIEFGGTKPITGSATVTARRGFRSDPLQSTVKRYGHTDSLNVQLSNFQGSGGFVNDGIYMKLANQGHPDQSSPQWHNVPLRNVSTTAGGPADEHWINLNFPGGLQNPTQEGLENIIVPFRARIHSISATGEIGDWINFPEFHIKRYSQTQFTMSLRIYWERKSGRPARPPAAGNFGGVWAYTHATGQNNWEPKTASWDAHEYFIDKGRRAPNHEVYSDNTYGTSDLLNMQGSSDRWEVWLDPDKFPQGRYEMQIMRGTSMKQSSYYPKSHKQWLNPGASGLGGVPYYDIFSFFHWSPASRPELDGVAVAVVEDGMVAEVSVASVSVIVNKQPSPSKDVACIAVKAKNAGNLGAISALCSRYTNDWTGTAWSRLTTTSNPAPHARDIYIGSLNARAVPTSLIDDDDFEAWRAQCIIKGYQCNAELNGSSVEDAFALVTGNGFAGPRNSEKFGVVYERDRSGEGVVCTFTPRNMNNFRKSNDFPQLSDGIRGVFADKTNNYQERSVVIWAGAARDTLEEMRYEGPVTEAEVIRRANFDLAHVRQRNAIYSWTAPVEYILCRKGDLVGVQSPVIATKCGYGRIRSLTLNGAATKISKITLDQTIPTFSQATDRLGAIPGAPVTTFGISILRKNGEVTTHTATLESDQRTIDLSPTVDVDAANINEGCLVTAGAIGLEFVRLIVREIIPKDSSSAQIVAFDEAPNLLAALEARTAATAGAPSNRLLDFSDRRNSGYVALLGGF